MEVAGFALTVVAFVKTTRSVSHLVKRIHRVAKDAPAIKEQLLQTAIPLKSFVTAVRAAHASLEHKCPDDSDSEVIQYIIRQGLPKDLEQQSFYLEHSIVQVKDRLSTLNSSWGDFITSYRWTKMRPEVEALFAPMESMKTTLSLILNVIILEMKTGECSGKPTAELEAEIAFLKGVIKEQIETIRQLREHHHFSLEGDDTKRLSVDSQVTLCHLANSMVESDSIPSTPPETFKFVRPRKRRHSRQSRNSEESFQTRSQRHIPPPSPPTTASGLGSVSPSVQPEQVADTPTADVHVPSPTTQSSVKTLNGRYRGRSGDVRIKAELNRELGVNLITPALARELGLDVDQTAPEINVSYNGEILKAVGKTDLTWNRRPFTCYLCEGIAHPVVFGRGFPVEMEQRRGS